MKDTHLLQTVELDSGRIEVYKGSIIFYNYKAEEEWEYNWEELYELTIVEANKTIGEK